MPRSNSTQRAISAAIERLEMRRLLSASVSVRGDTLAVHGDNGPNSIDVEETSAGLVVTADGNTRTVTRTIRNILVHGNNGNDDIDVTLQNDDGDRVVIDGGRGNDSITLQIGPTLAGRGAGSYHGADGSKWWNDRHDDNPLRVEVFGGAGDDDITVSVTVDDDDEDDEQNGTANNNADDDHDEQNRGLELTIDGASGDDDIVSNVLVLNLNSFDPDALPRGGGNNTSRGGSDDHDGRGDGDVNINILGADGDDTIESLVVLASHFDADDSNPTAQRNGNGGGTRGGSDDYDDNDGEPNLHVDVNGGAGDDDITLDVALLAADFGGGNSSPAAAPGQEEENDIEEIDFARVEIDVDGESGDDVIDVTLAAGDEVNDDGTPQPLGAADDDDNDDGQTELDLDLTITGGPGDDDISATVRLDNVVLPDTTPMWHSRGRGRGGYWTQHDPLVVLEGNSGDDTLNLTVTGVSDYSSLRNAFVINGGSGFDTCSENAPDNAVRIISCEDHADPV